MTTLVLDPAPWSQAESKEDKIKYLERQKTWLESNYKRERTKGWVMIVVNEMIKRYKSSEFVEGVLNWFYDQIIDHRAEWQLDSCYDPKQWYPVGRGLIQNKIRGGMG